MFRFFRNRDPSEQLSNLLYFRICNYTGQMRYGYQERFSEIVALVNAHPSILGGLNAEKLRGVKMAYQLQAEKIKHQQCENAARPSLIKEILDLKKEGE